MNIFASILGVVYLLIAVSQPFPPVANLILGGMGIVIVLFADKE